MIGYFLFILSYFYICNWVVVKVFVQNLLKEHTRPTELKDPKIHTYLKQVTNLEYKIYIVRSDKLFGFATRFFGLPQIFLSSRVHKELSWAELEWILFHEAAHCVLHHPIFLAVLQVSFCLVGLLSLVLMRDYSYLPIVSVLLALFLSSLYFQFNRQMVEWKADLYALARMSDPQGMIDANKRFKAESKSIFYNNKLLSRLFTAHPYYDERIATAEEKLKFR